jgi:hypothetical protein
MTFREVGQEMKELGLPFVSAVVSLDLGVALGFGLGFVASRVLQRIDDYLIVHFCAEQRFTERARASWRVV